MDVFGLINLFYGIKKNIVTALSFGYPYTPVEIAGKEIF